MNVKKKINENANQTVEYLESVASKTQLLEAISDVNSDIFIKKVSSNSAHEHQSVADEFTNKALDLMQSK